MFQNCKTHVCNVIKRYIIRFGLHQFIPFLIGTLRPEQRVKMIDENKRGRIPKWIYRFLCYEIGRCALRR